MHGVYLRWGSNERLL